jgi:DNA-binding beta-propeller fold protein YncE
VLSATKVSEYPVGVRSFDGGRQAIVAGLWSRRLDFLRVDANSKTTPLRKVESLSLQFSPRRLLVLPDERHAVVTDAFGGKLAVVDLHTRQVVRSARLNAHNIYGLAWDDAEDRLLIAHQMLNSSLPITFDNVQWGVLMRNVVRVIEREQLLAKEIDLSNATRVISLGQDGEGSADPTAVLPLPEGGFAAIMGGVDQIALVEAAGLVNKRIAVGRRPIALLEGHAPHALLVVNQFSATIDVVHTGQNEPLVSITLAALVRRLDVVPQLSH